MAGIINYTTHVVKTLDNLRVLVSDVFFNERSSFEQFLTLFTSEFAFIFLLNEWFNRLGQFANKWSARHDTSTK